MPLPPQHSAHTPLHTLQTPHPAHHHPPSSSTRHTMNPYGQWKQQGSAASSISIFGALPTFTVTSPPSAMQADCITIKFTSFGTTILNSTVVEGQNRTMYRVVTEPQAPACTVFKDNESKTVAMIRWQPNATVEVRGVLTREVRARDWLRLSEQLDRRTMEVGGVQYVWQPIEGFVCLYKARSPAPRVLARIVRMPTEILLELTKEAVNLNLLESALVAAALLNSGHNID